MDFIGAYSMDHLLFLLEGLGMTLKLAFIAIVMSFVIGCIIGAIRYTHVPVLSQLLGFFVGTIRNLPLLLIIFFTRFGLPELGVSITPFWSAILALTVFEAAMISELIRSGLQSVDRGVVEAARASGLSHQQTLWHIVLPIGVRRMVPPIVSQFISLLKDTSLVVIVSLAELMHSAKIIMAEVNYVFPILLLLAVIYFTVNFSLSQVARRLEISQH